MEAIVDLAQLQYNLNLGPGFGGYSELIKAVDFSEESLQELQHFSFQGYQRIRLYDSQVVEAVLTCWKPNQVGKIHNFHNSLGWFKVLSGELFLEHFQIKHDGPEKKYEFSYPAGTQGFLNDDLGFHRFSNPHASNAVAIFIYADKIEDWDVYNDATQIIERVPAKVDLDLDLVES